MESQETRGQKRPQTGAQNKEAGPDFHVSSFVEAELSVGARSSRSQRREHPQLLLKDSRSEQISHWLMDV